MRLDRQIGAGHLSEGHDLLECRPRRRPDLTRQRQRQPDNNSLGSDIASGSHDRLVVGARIASTFEDRMGTREHARRVGYRKADAALSVDWRVHKTPRGPLINDIEVEGYSLAIHYRGEFERVGVSTVPGLIDRLRGMTKDSPALPVVRRKMG